MISRQFAKFGASLRKMSLKHLTVGSVDPPRVNKELLRVYSMAYCPYAHRVWLVLKAKKVPYELVNIHLKEKPEWYFKIHPEGKVPAIIDGDKTLVESLVISDYLDERFPQEPLYPSDPEAKLKDKELLNEVESAAGLLIRFMYRADDKSPEGWVEDLRTELKELEDELGRRGTKFFGGNKPGMVDYMLWPFAERAPITTFRLGKKLPLKDDDIPLLRKWRKTMAKEPVVEECYQPPEAFWNIVKAILNKEMPPYDQIVQKL